MDADKNVRVSKDGGTADAPTPKDVMFEMSDPSTLQKGGRNGVSGGFNVYSTSLPGEPERMAKATGNVARPMGVRFTKDARLLSSTSPQTPTVMRDHFETFRLGEWKEAWLTLHAAQRNIHPHVYACGIRRLVGKHLMFQTVYVTARYFELDQGLLDNYKSRDWGSQIAVNVLELLAESGKAGILHGDLKTENIVYDRDNTGGPVVSFIDLSPQFSRFSSALPECIELINAVMLLVSVHCLFTPQFESATGFTLVIKDRVNRLVARLRTNPPDALYGAFLSIKATQLKRLGAEFFLYDFASPSEIANALLEIADGYGHFVPVDNRSSPYLLKPSKPCAGDGKGDSLLGQMKNTKKPAFETLLGIIERRLNQRQQAAEPAQFPLLSGRGEWKFMNASGSYAYDPSTHVLRTRMGSERQSKVVVAKAGVTGSGFVLQTRTLKSAGIEQHNGSIMEDIQTPPSSRRRVFVLPSQLNAAEYSTNDLPPSKLETYGLEDYLRDGTGGPRGQLAVDLGAAQFILDNASNVTREGKGINNVRGMGDVVGVKLRNGYLQVDAYPDVATFSSRLPHMTVLGIQGVQVRGLKAFGNPDIDHSFVNMDHTVDLIYASAVPFGTYGNPRTDKARKIVQMALYGQYVASLRLSILAGPCDVFLMPLGGGVFECSTDDIKSAMISAVDTLRDELRAKDVRVRVLTWKDSKSNPPESSVYV